MTPVGEGHDGPATRYVVGPLCGYGYAALGAAAGAGRLRGLDADRMASALGLAAYYCPVPSVLKWLRTMPFSMVKYAPMGWTAQAGATAALLAAKGYTADTSVLDSEHDFAQCWGSERFETSYLLEGLGSEWESIRWLNYNSVAWSTCRPVRSRRSCSGCMPPRARIAPTRARHPRLKRAPT